jgi:hypothetical protein
MTVTRTCYATREALKAAAGWDGSTTDADTDRLLETHSGKVDQLLLRHFYPLVATRLYDYPSSRNASISILWLDADLLTLTTFTASGTVIASADYYLGRRDDTVDQPYDRIELDATSSATFGAGAQRGLSVLGVWGYSDTTAPAGTLGATINDSVTALTVSDSSKVGVGDLIKIGSERMVVADRTYATTSKTLAAALEAISTDATISIATSHGLLAGETILVDTERMYIEVAQATALIVRRAVDGSTLVAHSFGEAIYAPRSLTVTRGAYGTTAAAHTAADAITRNVPPSLITDLVIAECIAQRVQESGGYTTTVGPGGQSGTERTALYNLRHQAEDAYGRVARVWL